MTVKEQMLINRGFSKKDIEENFANYSGEWNISTITLEEVKLSQTRDELLPLFANDSVDNKHFCTTYIGADFNYFAKDISPFTVAPSELDPHIARLCKAINDIGIKTCMSCDGWHGRNNTYSQMELYMTDRYSVLWFWLITEHIFGEHWNRKAPHSSYWKNIWEPFNYDPFSDSFGVLAPRDMMICQYNKDDKREYNRVFFRNFYYSYFLEKHRNEFLDLRRLIIDGLRRKIEKGEIDNIQTVKFLKIRQYMEEIFLPNSKGLMRAFKYECRNIPSL